MGNSKSRIQNQKLLFSFLVRSVLVAEPAILLVFDSPRLLSLVLGSSIIAMFADGAFQSYYFSHLNSLVKRADDGI